MYEIVVAFGTHDHSTRALEWAAQVARRASGRVVVFNVFHPTYAEMSHDDHLKLVAERQAHVEDVMARSGHEDFDIVVRDGEPIAKLLGYTSRTGCDLIVVGHHDSVAHGGFGEHGASEALLRSSTIPFVVVGNGANIPDGEKTFTMVVGIDGSEANADSVNTIAHLAKSLDARTVPVFSVNTAASTTRDNYGSRLVHQDEAERIAARLPNSDEIWLMNESPIHGLLDAAEDVDADLIAIGTRGHLDLSDLFAGQIGRHLIQQSHRPVLIAPHH